MDKFIAALIIMALVVGVVFAIVIFILACIQTWGAGQQSGLLQAVLYV